MTNDLIDKTLLKVYDKKLKTMASLLQRNYAYSVGDVVSCNGITLKCTQAGTTNTANIANLDSANVGDSITDGTVTWLVIDPLSTGIKDWQASTKYLVGDFVIKDDVLYECITANTDATFNPVKWKAISKDGLSAWESSKKYDVSSVVIYNNQIYRCKTAHTSSSAFNNDIANWDILDIKWQAKDWITNTYYLEGEVVLYNNVPYKCITAHTSLGTFDLDKANWEPLSANIREWISGITYKVGDTVKYDGELYECTTATSASTFKKSCWKPIGKCNISMWSASDDSTVALLHFNDSNNIYSNECGDSFTQPSDASSIYSLANSWRVGDSGYSMSDNSYCGIESPWYNLSSSEDVYTVEWWFYCTDISSAAINFANIQYYNPTANLTYNLTDYLGSEYSQTIALRVLGTIVSTLSLNTQYHIAVVLTNTTVKVFVNGITAGTYTVDASKFRIYSVSGTNTFGNHYIDELRISSIARYTSDFTPPTEPFSAGNAWGYKKDDLVVYNDKIYRCITANNDDVFTSSKWVEVSPCTGGGIEEWASGNDYTSGTVILYNNNLYKVVIDITNATDAPDVSNNYVKLGGNSIKTWEGSKEYPAGTIVLHQNRLYRNANAITSSVTTFSRNDWTPLSPILEDWTSNKDYRVGDFVIRNNVLYKCITDNNDATFNSSKWEPISKEGITAWQSNKQYSLYDTVVENEEVYLCIMAHTSSTNFQDDLDAHKWKLIGGGSSSGGGSLDQITKLNVVAPLDVDIPIPYTNTFSRPPVEVLKYTQGTTNITTNALTFNAGDGSKFEIDGVTAKDSQLVTFDGVVKPNHDITYSFNAPTLMTTKYYSESEEIDLSDYKVVGEVSLE